MFETDPVQKTLHFKTVTIVTVITYIGLSCIIHLVNRHKQNSECYNVENKNKKRNNKKLEKVT